MDFEATKRRSLAVLKAIGLAIVGAIAKELWEGQPFKGFAKLQTYEGLLTSHTPFWALLISLFIIGLLVPYWWRAIRSKNPALHLVWSGAAGWGTGGIMQQNSKMEPVFCIQGPAIITSSHLKESVTITGVQLKGAEYAGPNFQTLTIKPRRTLRRNLVLMFRGVTPAAGKAFKAELTLIDIKGTQYKLQPATLRAFPGQMLPSVQPSEPGPLLHASWRADSDWGWATPHPKEDPIYMIRGEVTLQMDNITDTVTITGVEIEGADFKGQFDNFDLIPGRVETKRMKIHFRGQAPKSIDDYIVGLVFRDLRGNRYPAAEHRFKPLPIEDRVEVERGVSLIPPSDASQ